MSYFTTHLPFTLMVKEFFRLVNIWRSYGQNRWMCHIPHSPCTFVIKDAISPDKLTVIKHCYVNRQLIIKKYQTAVDQFWLTHWQTDAVSDWMTADHIRHFAATAFLCCGSCVQWVMGFFYMADKKQLFVSELNNAYFSRHFILKQCLSG